MGYDGVELACWGAYLYSVKAAQDDDYCKYILDTLDKYGLKMEALAAHIIGQCVGDYDNPRLDNFVPSALAGKKDEIRAWAINSLLDPHIDFGNLRRGWNFRSLGHGDVKFDDAIKSD